MLPGRPNSPRFTLFACRFRSATPQLSKTVWPRERLGYGRRNPRQPFLSSVRSASSRGSKRQLQRKLWLDFYRVGVRAIKEYRPIARLKLDEVTSESAAEFAAQRRAQKGGLEVSTVNSSLRVLRRALRQAAEWGLIQAVPKIKMLPGERHRERVLSVEEEARYLLAASEPLS